MTEAPYFIIPDIKALKTATGEERRRHMRRIAANVGDEETLRRLLGLDPAEFANFYPDQQPVALSTDDTIANFIDRFAPKPKKRAPKPSENSENSEISGQTEISSPSLKAFKEKVKAQRYKEAIDILTQLNLKNPEKNIYFAYQIRFLEKLIKIQEKGTL